MPSAAWNSARRAGWLARSALQPLDRVAESFGHGDGAAVARRVGTLERFGQEFGDGFGLGQALFGQDLRPRGPDGLPSADARGGHEHHRHQRGDGEGGLVPPHQSSGTGKLRWADGPRIGSSFKWRSMSMAKPLAVS